MKSLALVSIVVLSLIALGGQAQFGTINGTVRDSSGTTIPGVTVTARDAANGKPATVVTNESGVYTLSNLPVGKYVVTAFLAGFGSEQSVPLTLGSTSPLRQDFSLVVGKFQFQSPSPSPFARPANVVIVADRQSTQGLVTTYRGHVRMTTDTMSVYADEVDFNSQTQYADIRGNVSAEVRQIGPRVVPLAMGK